MRLACFGWIAEDAGSVTSANYVIVRELLARGHNVVLFANTLHVPPPPGLIDHPGLDYIGIQPSLPERTIPYRVRRATSLFIGGYWGRAWRQRFRGAALPAHLQNPFDIVLTLGVAPPFTIPGVPTVTWVQGPQQTELEAIEHLRPIISAASGTGFYRRLSSYYRLAEWRERHQLDPCDHVICGSRWAMEAIRRNGFKGSLHALPYPIDLSRFTPETTPASPINGPRLLALGRLDPRKRLDLLVQAFEVFAEEFPEARLDIVGRSGYAPNQLHWLHRSSARDRISYRDAVPRDEVPALMRQADALIQTSENENFGSSVAEALACGVPVVVGPTNGTADYIDDRSQIFTDYTPQAVADATKTVLANRSADLAMSRQSARAAAIRWFSPAAVTDSLEKLLVDALPGGGGGTRRHA